MLATAVLDDAAAWVGLPIAFVATGLGLGLLVERALGLRLPSTAVLPLGACSSICLLLAVYQLGGHGWLAALILVLLTGAGLLLARRSLGERFAPGPAAAAGLAVYALYIVPTVLTGHWGWNGYNFLNDTAVQFLLADELKHHGRALLEDAFSTRSETLRIYFESGYPLGSHAQLATLATLLGSGVDVVYQGYLAMLTATAAVALTGLARRAGLGPWSAAAAGAIALAANLIYQYGMQGSIKELAAVMALATAAALGAELLASDRPVRAVVPVGIAAGAMVSVLSAAAGPYLAVLAVGLAVAALVLPARAVRSRLHLVAAAGAATAVVSALPTLITAGTFLQASTTTLAADSAATSTLGQLQRPLELIQIAGVWLSEDYGLPVDGTVARRLTQALAAGVLLLAAAAAVALLRRRALGPLALLISVLVTAAVLAPTASPYADAKLLAIASPVLVFVALCGALSWRGRLRVPGLVATTAVALSLLASAAFAYHGVRVAPVERLYALEDAVATVARSGWIFLDEVEEFAKYYGRDAPHLNVGFEAIAPRQALSGGYHLDLDDLDERYVQSFDALVTRLGPATSRAPSNYRRVHANGWYETWRKLPGLTVRRRLPLQDPLDAGRTPPCEDIRGLARAARGDDRIVAAPSPETVQLAVADAPDRPAAWRPIEYPPGIVRPGTPGQVEHTVRVDGGTYDAWVRGSTGRDIRVFVDGRRVGGAKGINAEGQWLPAGSVELGPGRHELRLERPGGDLAPGDGAQSVLGPLALVRREDRGLVRVRPSQAAELCGRRWDWIEVVGR